MFEYPDLSHLADASRNGTPEGEAAAKAKVRRIEEELKTVLIEEIEKLVARMLKLRFGKSQVMTYHDRGEYREAEAEVSRYMKKLQALDPAAANRLDAVRAEREDAYRRQIAERNAQRAAAAQAGSEEAAEEGARRSEAARLERLRRGEPEWSGPTREMMEGLEG